jgi:hypothetical protein
MRNWAATSPVGIVRDWPRCPVLFLRLDVTLPCGVSGSDAQVPMRADSHSELGMG